MVGDTANTDEVIPADDTARQTRPRSCAIALDLLGKKWTIPLLVELERGPRRRYQLRQALKVQNDRLDATVQMMVRWGVIERAFIPCGQTDGPGYAITQLGREFLDSVARLGEWQHDHHSELMANDREWRASHAAGHPSTDSGHPSTGL